MVEFSFDRDEFRPDPQDRRDQAMERERFERQQDEARRQDAFQEDMRREMERDMRNETVRRMVNDPGIIIDDTLMEIINNPMMTMDQDMVVRRRADAPGRRSTPLTGRQVVRRSGQFANLALGVDLEKPKRSRKKTKTDKLQSEALTQANAKLRKKNGKLRKGKTQADVMRLAHRIRKRLASN